jgi:peptidoglycan DL-endopeptidase CwlO
VPSTLYARRTILALVLISVAAGASPVTPAAAVAAYAAPGAVDARPVALPADRPTPAELDRRIMAAARRLETIVERYNDSREQLRAIRAEQRTLGSRLMPMTVDVRQREALIGGLAARTYQRTRNGPTVALFGSDSPHQFVDRLLVLNQLATEQQRAVAELHRARTELTATRDRLNALTAQQHAQQTRLSMQQAMVEGEIATLKQMRRAAYGGGSRYGDAMDYPTPPYVPGPAGQVVAFAFAQIGKPYRWGAEGPDSYDCSGLALSAWRTAGVPLPHNAARQYRATARLSRDDLRPGDLVFFYGPITHVGIYIGDSRMIHAPEYGEHVRIAPIDSLPVHGFGRPR